ncbi:MAG: AMP-binding protein, partial [Desulfatiglandales bacterium]
MRAQTLPELFFHQAQRRPQRIALRKKEKGIWNRITWSQYEKRVRETASSLIAEGLQKGDRVAILGDNRPEWLICHLATMSIGGVTCGVYSTSSPEEIAYVVGHSESKVLFVENEEQVDKVLEIIDTLGVKKAVVWDPKGLWGFSHPRFLFFEDFLKGGRELLQREPDCVDKRLSSLLPEDLAMMIYTSGTTGRPKGAMITHENIMAITESFTQVINFSEDEELL